MGGGGGGGMMGRLDADRVFYLAELGTLHIVESLLPLQILLGMDPYITVDHLGLLLHLIIELPACISFFLRPSATLSQPQSYAHGVIQQYALLLASTNLIVLAILSRPVDHLSGQVSGALAVYHIGPSVRAIARIRKRELGNALGGPWLHVLVHLICVGTLAMSFARLS